MLMRCIAILLVGSLLTPPGESGEERRVAAVLDELHAAASAADGARYFRLFDGDAVFLGTDASERWPIAEFRAYAQARFDTGRGWTYAVTARHVSLGPGGDTAWFDEALTNEKYGACRGTGVLIRRDGTWRIAQYNLTIPVPNDLALELARMIRAHEAKANP
jgi:ketosteroid isomerase-like protein